MVLPSHLIRPYLSPPMRITKLLLNLDAKIAIFQKLRTINLFCDDINTIFAPTKFTDTL